MPKLKIPGVITLFSPYSVMAWCWITETTYLDTNRSISVTALQVPIIKHKNEYADLLFMCFVPFRKKMHLFVSMTGLSKAVEF
jgi:hypothetical protein